MKETLDGYTIHGQEILTSRNRWLPFNEDYIQAHFGQNTALAVQQATHNLFRTNPLPLPRKISTELALTGNEHILDIGCGNGLILREVANLIKTPGSLTGIDISPAMLALAKEQVKATWVPVHLKEMNAYDALTLGAGQFDRVMANYVFHYITEPDIFCGILAKLITPRGKAIITIEGRYSMPEMYALHELAMMHAGFAETEIEKVPLTRRGIMVLENAADYLSKSFAKITEIPYRDSLIFKDAEPFMTFYSLGHEYCGIRRVLRDKVSNQHLDDIHDFVRKRVASRIMSFGFFELTKKNSIFVCEEPL